MKRCDDCGSGPMVPSHLWRPGQVRDAGRSICGRCSTARRRNGTLIDTPQRNYSLEDFVDTWRSLVVRGGCINLSTIAAAMGRHPSTVRRRLREARLAGLHVPEVSDDRARMLSQALRKDAA